ncbi:hypothetical protein EON68_00500, partial [archaeon]
MSHRADRFDPPRPSAHSLNYASLYTMEEGDDSLASMIHALRDLTNQLSTSTWTDLTTFPSQPATGSDPQPSAHGQQVEDTPPKSELDGIPRFDVAVMLERLGVPASTAPANPTNAQRFAAAVVAALPGSTPPHATAPVPAPRRAAPPPPPSASPSTRASTAASSVPATPPLTALSVADAAALPPPPPPLLLQPSASSEPAASAAALPLDVSVVDERQLFARVDSILTNHLLEAERALDAHATFEPPVGVDTLESRILSRLAGLGDSASSRPVSHATAGGGVTPQTFVVATAKGFSPALPLQQLQSMYAQTITTPVSEVPRGHAPAAGPVAASVDAPSDAGTSAPALTSTLKSTLYSPDAGAGSGELVVSHALAPPARTPGPQAEAETGTERYSSSADARAALVPVARLDAPHPHPLPLLSSPPPPIFFDPTAHPVDDGIVLGVPDFSYMYTRLASETSVRTVDAQLASAAAAAAEASCASTVRT